MEVRQSSEANAIYSSTCELDSSGLPKSDYDFGRENGEEVLRRQFPRVETHDIDGEVTFADYEAARAYVEASPVRAYKAGVLRRFDGPLVARRRVSVFVADR